MIAHADIEHARAVRIEDEIARRGITLKRVGAELIGACPVCGGRDRFSVNIRKRVFNCRGAVGGDVITMVQHLDGCQFGDAITTLACGSPRKPPAKLEKDDSYNDEQRNLDRAETIWREDRRSGLTQSHISPNAASTSIRCPSTVG